MRRLLPLALLLCCPLQTQAATRLDDEGSSQGYINAINCVGGGLSCSRSGITGTLTVETPVSVASGGTGAATLTLNGVLYGNGTSAIQATAQGAANTVLAANAGAPSFSAAPTIGTSVTTPLLIGGTAAASTLSLKSTTGVGAGSDAVIFQVGNNGGSEAMRAKSSTVGQGTVVGIGTASPNGYATLHVSGNSAVATMVVDNTSNTAGQSILEIDGNTTSLIAMKLINKSNATPQSVGFGFVSNGTPANADTPDASIIAYYDAISTSSQSNLLFYTTNNGPGNNSERMRINPTGKVGIGTTAPTNDLSFGGNAARKLWMERHTTANTAGNALTVQAGGATSAATNKNGGNLVLSSGVSTGSGTGQVLIQTSPGTAAATSDNTLTTAVTVAGSGATTFSDTLTSSRTTDLGWSVVNAANQACNTTCTSACVVGIDTAAVGNFLSCTDATADSCLCAGSS